MDADSPKDQFPNQYTNHDRKEKAYVQYHDDDHTVQRQLHYCMGFTVTTYRRYATPCVTHASKARGMFTDALQA